MQTETNQLTAFLVASTVVVVFLGAFIITMIFLHRKKQIAYYLTLEKLRSDFEHDLLKAQIEIQEHTFLEISREIHDNINLSLSLAKLNLNRITNEITHPSLHESIHILSNVINDLTNLSRSMNADVINSCGLIDALKMEVTRINKLNQMRVDYRVTGNSVYMDAKKELFAYRIIQEAINNVLKHAKAKNLLINLYYSLTHLQVEVKDDGVGFNINTQNWRNRSNGSAGLKNMDRRTQIVGGDMEIHSCIGKGTVVAISIPYQTS
jgi:signal transduction histidine kinase